MRSTPRRSSPPVLREVRNASRLATLVATGLLDSPIEEAFDRLTRLAAHIIRAPVSLVSLVAEEKQFFKSVFGLPDPWAERRETPLTHSFCKHVVETGEPLVIFDARVHPLVERNLAIRDLGVIAYAGMPLFLRNGECLGSFCVIDSKPRLWTSEELHILHELAASVATEIELRLASQARQELLDLVFHDLRNPLSVVMLSAQLLRKPLGEDPRAISALARVEGSGTRMARIIEDVAELLRIEDHAFELNRKEAKLPALVERAVEGLVPLSAPHGTSVRLDAEGTWMVRWDEERMIRALINLIGALASAYENPGEVCIEVRHLAERESRIVVSAPALTVPSEELAHFFDRFWKTTLFRNKGTKLALCLARLIIELHGGKIEVARCPGGGIEIRAIVPDDAQAEAGTRARTTPRNESR